MTSVSCLRAISSRSGTLSTPITRSAPRYLATRVHICPMGPRPMTAQVLPGSMSAYFTACQAVLTTSERNRNRSSGCSCGTLIGPNGAWGTRRYCACAPGTEPYSEVYPNSRAPLCCSVTCVVSHWAK